MPVRSLPDEAELEQGAETERRPGDLTPETVRGLLRGRSEPANCRRQRAVQLEPAGPAGRPIWRVTPGFADGLGGTCRVVGAARTVRRPSTPRSAFGVAPPSMPTTAIGLPQVAECWERHAPVSSVARPGFPATQTAQAYPPFPGSWPRPRPMAM